MNMMSYFTRSGCSLAACTMDTIRIEMENA